MIELKQMAREAYAKHNGDKAKATAAVVAEVRGNIALIEAWAARAVAEVATAAVGHKVRHDRGTLVKQVMRMGAGKAQFAATAAGVRGMLDMTLISGRRLRDATLEQVRANAEFYEKQGGDMLHKARFFRSVMQHMRPGQTVAEAVSEARAVELFQMSAASKEAA